MNRILEFLRWLCIRRFGNVWLYAGVGGFTALLSVIACFARHSWRFDLLVNFYPQYALALLACCAALLLYRRWLFAACLSPFQILCLVFVVPLYLPSRQSPLDGKDGRHYKLMVFNVLSSNKDIGATLSFIEAENPDFIVMTEYTDKWAEAAKTLSKRYMLQIQEPHTDNFGLAIFGRFDAETHLSRTGDEFGLPTHCADFTLPDGRNLRLVGTHAIVPISRILFEERNKCLLRCAKLCREAGMPSLMAGDFNMTPFSPFYGDILKEGGLVSASGGRGICLTWPTWRFLMLKPMSMQIDQCLVSDGIEVLDWRRGPDLGSDHYPLIVEFALK